MFVVYTFMVVTFNVLWFTLFGSNGTGSDLLVNIGAYLHVVYLVIFLLFPFVIITQISLWVLNYIEERPEPLFITVTLLLVYLPYLVTTVYPNIFSPYLMSYLKYALN